MQIEWRESETKPIWYFSDCEAYCCVMKTWAGWTYRITVNNAVVKEESGHDAAKQAMQAAEKWWGRWREEQLPSADLNICAYCKTARNENSFVVEIPILHKAKSGAVFRSGERPHTFCAGSVCVTQYCWQEWQQLNGEQS